jgi:hypothetical protein
MLLINLSIKINVFSKRGRAMPACHWCVEKGGTLCPVRLGFPARDLLGILLVLEILRLLGTYCSWFTHPCPPSRPILRSNSWTKSRQKF